MASMKRRQFLMATAAAMIGGRRATLAVAHNPGEHRMSTNLSAGVAVRSLMPDPEIVNNSLHSNMTVRFDERGSPLQVKALALQSGQTRKLLLAADIVGVPTPHARQLLQVVADTAGLVACDIVLSASHSHSTPFLEPLDGPHPYFDFVLRQSVDAAGEAVRSLKAARIGYGVAHAVGASFNTRVPMPDGSVKFTRDFREGLASGRPIDPRLSLLRIDDERGKPIAGWVRFAAHPACVIFDAPISAEYPGYMTGRLSELIDGSPPILFGYGASGDVNCVPMFGKESDSRRLGHQLAALAVPTFESIKTALPRRFRVASRSLELPLDPPPSVETLDREIEAVEQFSAALDKNPELEWVLGINCKKDWPVEKKKRHVKPLADWARKVKELLAQGHKFPTTWPRQITTWILDDLGLVFESGETLTEVSLLLSARSPLAETLLVSLSNGSDAYLGSDADRRRGGYETYTSTRYAMLRVGSRPLPYALGAADCYIDDILKMIDLLEVG